MSTVTTELPSAVDPDIEEEVKGSERLQPGQLPCAVCGVAVDGLHDPADVIEVAGGVGITPAGQTVEREPIPATHCAACLELRELADQITAAHDPLVRLRGLEETRESVLNVLLGLRVGAGPSAVLPRPDCTPQELGALLRWVAPGGRGVQWRYTGWRTHECNAEPFDHVLNEVRVNLRRGCAAALSEKLAHSKPPVRVTPPEAVEGRSYTKGTYLVSGCGICGRASFTVPAMEIAREGGLENAARSRWTLHGGVSVQALGGAPSPARMAVWLCTVCEDHYRAEGGFGPTLNEVCVYSFLNRPRLQLDNLVVWGGLVADELRAGRRAPRASDLPWTWIDPDSIP